MDETVCSMDMPSDTAIHKTGARSVSLKTSGHEKDHYTVILTALADAVKLKPYILFKGKGTCLMKTLQKIDEVVVVMAEHHTPIELDHSSRDGARN